MKLKEFIKKRKKKRWGGRESRDARKKKVIEGKHIKKLRAAKRNKAEYTASDASRIF